MRVLSLNSSIDNSVPLSWFGIVVSQAPVSSDWLICLACICGALALISAAVDLCLLSSLHRASLWEVFAHAVCAAALKWDQLKSDLTSNAVLFSDVSKIWLAVVVGSGIPRLPSLTDRAVSLWIRAMFTGASSNRAERKCLDMAFLIGAKAMSMLGVTRWRNSHSAWRDLVSPVYAIWGKCFAMQARAQTL
jgi:hypothetical protein